MDRQLSFNVVCLSTAALWGYLSDDRLNKCYRPGASVSRLLFHAMMTLVFVLLCVVEVTTL
jgi:hypothetical protein